NRIGVLAGYGPPDHRFRYDPDPNAYMGKRFVEEVGAEGYSEGWADELQVFHNPRALRPLPRECFGPLHQHFFEGGKIVTYYGTDAVLWSITMILHAQHGDEADAKVASTY